MKPIITSLTSGIDAYKFTMNGFLQGTRWYAEQWRASGLLGDVNVRFAFTNRSNDAYPLTDLIDYRTLSRQLAMARELRFSESEIAHITGTFSPFHAIFASDEYRAFLKDYRLPPITLKRQGNAYTIESRAPWKRCMFWETIALRIVARLAAGSLAKHVYGSGGLSRAFAEGERRLAEKIRLFSAFPDMEIIEFGTRRAADPDWHLQVLNALVRGLLPGQLMGTSNVGYAQRLGIPAKGTMAHELFSGFAAVMHCMHGEDAIRPAHMMMFDLWQEFYKDTLLIALCDTFTSKSFYEDFGSERLKAWSGVRDDSGDPIAQTELYDKHLRTWNIDPKRKVSFLADGQKPETMMRCLEHFRGRMRTPFGPGTNLTNDLGIPNLSLVMKLVEVEWRGKRMGAVKLSNNRKKSQGDPRLVALYERIHGVPPHDEPCQY